MVEKQRLNSEDMIVSMIKDELALLNKETFTSSELQGIYLPFLLDGLKDRRVALHIIPEMTKVYFSYERAALRLVYATVRESELGHPKGLESVKRAE